MTTTTPADAVAILGDDETETLAEKLVDAIGEALGVDTGVISEVRFADAVKAAQEALKATEHTTDADCTVDPSTGCCVECGVDHNVDPCAKCGGQGFHNHGCENAEIDCRLCGGDGYVGDGRDYDQPSSNACPACDGTGTE